MGEPDGPESLNIVFDVFDGPPDRASYQISSIKSARWTEAGEDLAELLLHLADGTDVQHNVAKRTAINVCERIGK